MMENPADQGMLLPLPDGEKSFKGASIRIQGLFRLHTALLQQAEKLLCSTRFSATTLSPGEYAVITLQVIEPTFSMATPLEMLPVLSGTAGHAEPWLASIRKGGMRGFIASLMTWHDLMLIIPAVLSGVIMHLTGRKY